MTTLNDDINDLGQLRQNLQLRRELGAQAPKARAAISCRRNSSRSSLFEEVSAAPIAEPGSLPSHPAPKWRREIGAEVIEAKDSSAEQASRIAYGSGWVLYWTCLAMAGVSAFFMLRLTGEWHFDGGTLIATSIAALIFHGLGQDIRYVLSGK
jgi:hypothetical protein